MSTQWFTEAVIVASVVGLALGALLMAGFAWMVGAIEDWLYIRRERQTNAERWAALAQEWPKRKRIARDLDHERKWS